MIRLLIVFGSILSIAICLNKNIENKIRQHYKLANQEVLDKYYRELKKNKSTAAEICAKHVATRKLYPLGAEVDKSDVMIRNITIQLPISSAVDSSKEIINLVTPGSIYCLMKFPKGDNMFHFKTHYLLSLTPISGESINTTVFLEFIHVSNHAPGEIVEILDPTEKRSEISDEPDYEVI